MRLLGLVLLVISLGALPSSSLAQWQADGAKLCTAPNSQFSAVIVPDGEGGAIIAWSDYRNGLTDIYAQRVNALGAAQWTVDGVALCTAPGMQEYPAIASDGAGGAIVTWEDNRISSHLDIYAQRVLANGAPVWATDGVQLCGAIDNQRIPTIVSDHAGGAIVAWSDRRSGLDDVYAQRVDEFGSIYWATNGVALCSANGHQYNNAMISDGVGGAIVAWQDYRLANDNDIFVQRVNGSGVVGWTLNGIAVCTAMGEQYSPVIICDGSAGAIIAWQDLRSGNYDIYAQRIDAPGVIQWMVNGAPLCTLPREQFFPAITSDNSGGAIVTWQDYRSGSHDIFAQRISAAGLVQWTADGAPVSTSTGYQVRPQIVSDGAGGAIVTFQDAEFGFWDIYAQGITASGAIKWTTGGVAICTAENDQEYPVIASNGTGGAIVTWWDSRTDSTATDLYAHWVNASGVLPTGVRHAPYAPAVSMTANYPNPFSASTSFGLRVSIDSDVTVGVFDVAGRHVRQIRIGRVPAGVRSLYFDGRDEGGRLLPSGVYFFRVTANGSTVAKKMVIAR